MTSEEIEDRPRKVQRALILDWNMHEELHIWHTETHLIQGTEKMDAGERHCPCHACRRTTVKNGDTRNLETVGNTLSESVKKQEEY